MQQELALTKNLLVVSVLMFLGIGLPQLAHAGWGTPPELENKQTEARIRPVAVVNIDDGSAPVQPAAPAAPREAADIYAKVCTACHATGVLNAPKFENKADWAARQAKGLEALLVSAIKGLNAMPPRGGDPSLSDDEMKATIQFMLPKAEGEAAAAPVAVAAPAAAPAEAPAAAPAPVAAPTEAPAPAAVPATH